MLYKLAAAPAGCGLPPGPSGLLGAAEGVSYLSVVGIAAWGLASKISSGKGLPAGQKLISPPQDPDIYLEGIQKLCLGRYPRLGACIQGDCSRRDPHFLSA